MAAVERRDFQTVERLDDHLLDLIESDVIDEQPEQMTDRDAAFVLCAELAQDRIGLRHVRFGFEQLFICRAHVAGARRADRDHIIEAESFGLRVRARVEHARDVAVGIVEHRCTAA